MRILIIEDDKRLCDNLAEQLENQQINTDKCYSGEDALYYAFENIYDVIILDRMLPVLDGLSILQLIRKKNITTPVIMVTAMNGINDRVDGLDSGADDYLVKPFAPEELFARIRALSRRFPNITSTESLSFCNIRLDITNKTLSTSEGKTCSLSKKECELLEFFLKNKMQILEREQILSRVWGADNFVSDGNLDNYISLLRRRLKLVSSNAVIKTIHSIGYRMEESPK